MTPPPMIAISMFIELMIYISLTSLYMSATHCAHILSKFLVLSLFLNLKPHERPTMVGWQVAADACATFLIAFVFDGTVLMELGHQIAALVGNKHVEGHKLAYQVVTDTAQEFVNSLPLES